MKLRRQKRAQLNKAEATTSKISGINDELSSIKLQWQTFPGINDELF
jgi:hypothetical protein